MASYQDNPKYILETSDQISLLKAIQASQFDESNSFLNVKSDFVNPRIYIRPSYLKLDELIRPLILKKEKRCLSVRLLGTPGIGKTYFCLFFIKRLIDANLPFIYDSNSSTNESLGLLFFRDGDILKVGDKDLRSILDSTEAIFYVVDGKAPRVDLSRQPNVSTLLVCSPRIEYFKRFEKVFANLVRRIEKYYLPTWTFEELLEANSAIKLSPENLEQRFKICGGVPGIVFSKDTDEEIENEVRQAIFESDLATLKSVMNFNGICNIQVSHLLLNFVVEEDLTKYRTDFASYYILRLVERRFENEINNELSKFFALEESLTE